MKQILLFSCLLIIISCQQKDNLALDNATLKPIQNQSLPSLPKEMELFGQKINLEDEDIKERLDREIIMNTYAQSATNLYIKRANRFFGPLEVILKNEQGPDDFKYLAVAESGLANVQSPVGASGFWQFMPATAKEYGLVINDEIDQRLALEKSTHAACQYLKNVNQVFNNWIMTAAAFNRGLGGVRSDMKRQYTDHYFDSEMNNETARYVFRIMALKIIMENPKAYGYYITKEQLYQPLETIKIKVKSPIKNLALWSKNNGVNLKIVRKLNPWILKNSLINMNQPQLLLLPGENCKLKNYASYSK